MKRGPIPIPTPIMEVRGGLRSNRRLHDEEVQYDKTPPDCPKWLTGPAKKEWNRLVEKLQAVGVLQSVDLALLASYCWSWGELGRLAAKPVKDQDWRWAVQMDRCQKRLSMLAQQFGFSPSARVRVRGGRVEGKEDEGSILGFARKRGGA